MKASVVKIGNSRGIRIPKPIFEQCGFKEEVELEIENKRLVVRPTSQARQNWADKFDSMSERKEDMLESDYEGISNEWDDSGWEWK